MARGLFGGTSADFVADDHGNTRAGVVCTVWSAESGGTQYTDLLNADGDAVTTITSASTPKGMVEFEGPDGVATVWVSAAGASRVKMTAPNLNVGGGVTATGLKERALLAGAPTPSWYQEARYGFMTHYTYGGVAHPQTIYSDGTVPASINDLADDFDADRFAADVAGFGAEYVTFTAWHYAMHALYPSAVMATWLPGHASTRDVIADLITALQPYGIRLMLYIHLTDGADLTAGEQTATGWADSTSSYATWNGFINALLVEMGQRYGDSVDGYWIDQVSAPEWAARYPTANRATLRLNLLAGNANRVLVGNAGSDTLRPPGGVGVTDLASREYISRPASVNDWLSGYNQTLMRATTAGASDWWATIPTGSSPTSWAATDMFRFTVLQAGTNTRGGGTTWNAGNFAGSPSSLWEDGVETRMEAIAALIAPIEVSIKGTIPSASYVTASTVTLSTLTTGFVATTSSDGITEYLHVLTAPGGSSLTVVAPADGVTFSSATNLVSGRAVSIEPTSVGGYTLTLDAADGWSATDTVIALTRVTALSEQVWVPATTWTTANGATLQTQGGGSRFPLYMLDDAVSNQIQCSFTPPADWNTFDVDMYWTQTVAGSGDALLTATRSQVIAGGSLTAGDEVGQNGAATMPGSVGPLAVLTIFNGLRNTPRAVNHIRISRSATGGGDTGPDCGVLGILLRRVT